MGRGKGKVPFWVPILCQHHVFERPGKAIGEGDGLFAVWHRKRTAGTKIVLDVDADQDVFIGWCDSF